MTASPMTAGEHDEVFHSFVFCLPLVTIKEVKGNLKCHDQWSYNKLSIFVKFNGVINNPQFLVAIIGGSGEPHI